MNTKNYLLCLVVIGLLGAPGVLIASQKLTRARVPLVSAIPENYNIAKEQEVRESISYYIIGSQQFLEKARKLANANPNQSQEDKKEIMMYVEKALSLVEQAIQAYPQDPRGYAQKAQVYQSLTFLPQAKALAILNLEKAAGLQKENPLYQKKLAELYQETNQYLKAASSYFNLHLTSPTDVQVLYHLAENLEKAGELEKARGSYEKLLALLENDEKGKEVIKEKINNLNVALREASLTKTTPKPGAGLEFEEELFEDRSLPLKKAYLAGRVIIAEAEEEVGTSEGKVKTNAQEGLGVLPAGENQVRIKAKLGQGSYVYVLPTSDAENKVLSVKAKKACDRAELCHDRAELCQGWFEVGIDKSSGKEIEFKWWVID